MIRVSLQESNRAHFPSERTYHRRSTLWLSEAGKATIEPEGRSSINRLPAIKIIGHFPANDVSSYKPS